MNDVQTPGRGGSQPGPAVELSGIGKRFGRDAALENVSLTVGWGELFGLIGPDGAGKTTLFRILTTLLLPDAGEARVLGLDVRHDIWAIRSAVGYMPGRFSLYPDLSVDENLRFFASVFGTDIESQYDLIAPIYRQLEPFRDRRAHALSGGMKQKLALCCALVHRPRILLLDEPTTGVDAVSRREFWDLLDRLHDDGLTIVVSTPYMDEATRCDRVALIHRGKILDVATPARIGEAYPLPLFAVTGNDRYRILRTLRDFPEAHAVYPFGAVLHYTDSRSNVAGDVIRAEVTDYLVNQGHEGVKVSPIEAGIEDSFIWRTAGAESGAT